MLLSTGPTSVRLVGLTFFILVFLAFLNHHSWAPGTWDWDPPPPLHHPGTQEPEAITLKKTVTALSTTTETVLSTIVATTTVALPAADTSLPSIPPTFPKKIWYKLGHKGQSEESKGQTASCRDKNPSYRIEYLTDASALAWVKETFVARPDIVSTYSALSIPIFQADLLRYLLMYAEGGVWMDLDVSCEDTPIETWLPENFKESDVNLIVGVEFDVGLGYSFERQFATWTVVSKPHLPHMLMVVEDIIESLNKLAKEQNITIADIKKNMVEDVVYFSGPQRFSRSVAKSLKQVLRKEVNSDSYAEVMEPRLIGDVLVLPGYALATSVNTYPEGKGGKPLVKHHYAGSWKNDQGGED